MYPYIILRQHSRSLPFLSDSMGNKFRDLIFLGAETKKTEKKKRYFKEEKPYPDQLGATVHVEAV